MTKKTVILFSLSICIGVVCPAQVSEQNSVDYKPNIHGTIRAKYEYQPEDNKGRFEVRNARVSVDGNVARNVSYKAELDLSDMSAIHKWFETQDSINYWEEFNKPKIIYPNMTKYMPFVYDEAMYLTNQKCFIMTGSHMAYLTAFLNSSLFKFCFRDSFPELQGGTRELSKIFFDKIPVKQITNEQNNVFREALNKIQYCYTKEYARLIDSMIFDLYNLTEYERQIIGFLEIQ